MGPQIEGTIEVTRLHMQEATWVVPFFNGLIPNANGQKSNVAEPINIANGRLSHSADAQDSSGWSAVRPGDVRFPSDLPAGRTSRAKRIDTER